MAKREKKPEEPPAGLPGWLATYSDMVTLLLTFFVMLMAMASFDDTAKVSAVIESIQMAFGVDGFDAALLGSMDAEALTSAIRHEEAVQPVFARIRQAMSEHVSDELVKVTQAPNEVRLRLDDRVFFRPGSTTLHPSAFAVVSDIAKIVAEYDAELIVEGHSDASGNEVQNWELSALRAVAVVQAVRTRGPVDGNKLTAASFGSHRPSSQFDEDEAWNRRIEFVIRTDDVNGAAASRALMEVQDGR